MEGRRKEDGKGREEERGEEDRGEVGWGTGEKRGDTNELREIFVHDIQFGFILGKNWRVDFIYVATNKCHISDASHP